MCGATRAYTAHGRLGCTSMQMPTCTTSAVLAGRSAGESAVKAGVAVSLLSTHRAPPLSASRPRTAPLALSGCAAHSSVDGTTLTLSHTCGSQGPIPHGAGSAAVVISRASSVFVFSSASAVAVVHGAS